MEKVQIKQSIMEKNLARVEDQISKSSEKIGFICAHSRLMEKFIEVYSSNETLEVTILLNQLISWSQTEIGLCNSGMIKNMSEVENAQSPTGEKQNKTNGD